MGDKAIEAKFSSPMKIADGDQITAQDLELDELQISQPTLEEDQLTPTLEAAENLNLSPKNGHNGTEIASNKSENQDIESVEREHILKVLTEVNGNRTKAVEILGISARALRYKLKSYKDAGFLNE